MNLIDIEFLTFEHNKDIEIANLLKMCNIKQHYS